MTTSEHTQPTGDRIDDRTVASRNPADMAVDTGHRVDDVLPPDEQQLAEQVVKEGVREAEQERMTGTQEDNEAGA